MRLRRLVRDQSGYTMIAVVGAMATVSLLVTAALAATNGDLNLVRRDLLHKQAYAAAQAGIADYSYHLNNDNSYWAKCTSVPMPNAVNQMGSTARRRAVPGTTESSYAIELVPATGQSACSTSNPVGTMLEQGGLAPGSFRIRATGYSGDASVSVVATYKRASLLDYVYFTQLETSDPVTYGFANPSSQLNAANTQCSKFRREGRPRVGSTSPSSICDTIVFVEDDDIDGPMHTNDDLCINSGDTPSFGRNASDVIEVSASAPGYHTNTSSGNGCTGNNTSEPSPGTFTTNAPVLTPPPTNGKLKTIAGITRTGQTQITLNGNNVTLRTGNGSSQSFPIPSSGVIYIANGTCSASYNPFTVTYPSSSGCGNAIVRGNYSGQLTIAAENDIIVDEDIRRNLGTGGLLGLVANNFVRVKHPVSDQTSRNDCGDNEDDTGTIHDLRIDAAILAISHSFIVDHYNCGDELGELEVNGAISQKFRGAVGTTGGTGYIKDYNYDDRLRYQEPPFFLDPVQSAWHLQRSTLDYP
jgi:hypothetical protein